MRLREWPEEEAVDEVEEVVEERDVEEGALVGMRSSLTRRRAAAAARVKAMVM